MQQVIHTSPTGIANTELSNIGVDEYNIAKMLGISLAAVRADRYGSKRIPFFKFGDRVLYNPTRVTIAMMAFEQGGDQLKRTKKTNSK
jgi:hypothetical protein